MIRDKPAPYTAVTVACFKNQLLAFINLPKSFVSMLEVVKSSGLLGVSLGERNYQQQTCMFPSLSLEYGENVRIWCMRIKR